ncbi:ABC transporter substrate-binding protein [Arthrobacter sp. STN4]|uniref:ABC transporter substrate-binding protein n=1 Tax=Arthrobacter sp. STN4 TaxID=2923276 RepID=UPI00211A7713|nr:ABC transporter substrate-binding protein [Arthrobacter sp. STN4]MCQ9165972.1 ABC transporter substrate-binding protein [Arthrobacter sp. STN4]
MSQIAAKKKFFRPTFLMLVPLAVMLAGCGGTSSAENAPTSNGAAPLHSMLPKNIQDSGTINIASNVEYPPFETFDTDGKTVIGIDREIADALEKKLGVTIKFNNISFDAIIPGLSSGRYDMAMSAMSDTLEREKQVDFVDYFMAGAGILRTMDNPHKVSTLDDLCGMKVGIVKGTTETEDADAQSKKCQATGKPALDVTIFPGQNQTILAIQTGRVDVVLLDSTSGSSVAKDSGGKLEMLKPYQAGPFGIVFPKGATQLEKAIQQGMTDIHKDGTYKDILKKYGQEQGAVEEFTINKATS